MVERHDGGDAGGLERLDEVLVEADALGVDAAAGGARRHDARPRDRQAVGLDAQLAHQLDVGLVAVVVVDRDAASRVAGDLALGGVGKRVPDRQPFTVGVPRALDLVR